MTPSREMPYEAAIEARSDKSWERTATFVDHALGMVCLLLLFSHFSYARFYLGSILLAPLSLPHYLLRGRKRKLTPNPFFDPLFMGRQAGDICFLQYMCGRKYWGLRPSLWFCPEEGDVSGRINPLARFQILDRRRNRSSHFDSAFVRSAVCRDRIQKRWVRFQIAASSSRRLPMNGRELFAAQCAYRASIKYRVLRASERHDRRFLVFVQAGADFHVDSINGPRDFDVMLNYYDLPERVSDTAEIVTWQAGTKTTAIANVLRHNAELMLRYDAVLFLDDDIGIDCRQINRLFDLFQTARLDLAQPSLSAESSCYFRCLKQPDAGGALRRMNGVEIMMPMMSRRVLREFGWIFSEGVSGWGVDLLMSAKVRERFGETVALIGEVVVVHKRPVDLVNGALYLALRRNGIDANSEAGDIVRRHALPHHAQRIRPMLEAQMRY